MKLAPAAAVFAALLGSAAGAAEIPLSERKSGYDLVGPQTRAMQDDDTKRHFLRCCENV